MEKEWDNSEDPEEEESELARGKISGTEPKRMDKV